MRIGAEGVRGQGFAELSGNCYWLFGGQIGVRQQRSVATATSSVAKRSEVRRQRGARSWESAGEPDGRKAGGTLFLRKMEAFAVFRGVIK
jgi:hypothetical protein